MKDLPKRGFVFWPVGTGDSTTIPVDDEVVIHIDLHHLASSNEDDDPHEPIVDRLVELLPKRDDKPYLAVFILTHPDEDHCLGFADLLKKVTIGELWHTPRIFREYVKDLCDDAKAFRKEAKRRVKKTINNKGDVASGDRVRIVGYDDLMKEDDYKGFPKDRLTIPGTAVCELDGSDYTGVFRAFVHAPFKDDSDKDRNDSSLGLQVGLSNKKATGFVLLLGDLCYPTIRRIFDNSEESDVSWNVFLAPHHCSKSVMYWKDSDDEDEKLKQDILDDIENSALSPGHIVASSEPIPSSDKKGANPPHKKAADRYKEIAPDGFLCTQEHPNSDNPKAIVFKLTKNGLKYENPEKDSEKKSSGKSLTLAAAANAARGSNEPPRDRVGFGNCWAV